MGTLNPHMGLLPRYRGMNVAEWSRLEGSAAGVSVHLVDEGIDTGPIVATRSVDVSACRSVATLRKVVHGAQLELLGEVVRYVQQTGQLPHHVDQTADDGRQYFAMHPELKASLDRQLGCALGADTAAKAR
jgi:folate-dependent phosphoribosylglycinamide formyltransferase PurN